MITLLTYYLWEHYQRVVLDGQTLSWELVKSGVTQGSESWTNLESNFKIFIIFYKVFDKLLSCNFKQRLKVNKQLGFSMEDAVQSRLK